MQSSGPPRPIYKPALIGAWLQHLRWTPAKLARATGITSVQVGRLIKGERPYTQQALELIAATLQISVIELLAVDPLDPESRGRVASEVAKVPVEAQRDAASYLAYLAEKRVAFDAEPAPATQKRTLKPRKISDDDTSS